MTKPNPQRRWFHVTPGWLIVLLLAVEGLLWLSNRLGWPQWHKGHAVLAAVAAVGVFLVLMLLWFLVAVVFRLRLQFSLRSLLVVTVAVALPCSWLAVEMKRAREQGEAVAAIVKLGGRVISDDQPFFGGPRTEPPPAWLDKLLGDDFFTTVNFVRFFYSQVTDAALEHLKGLNQLQLLGLDNTKVTDAGLEHLKDNTGARIN